MFVFWCDEQPADALFEEIIEHRDRWYAVRAVRVAEYARAMRPRSARWGTVHLDPKTFERISGPLAGRSETDAGPDLPVFEPITERP